MPILASWSVTNENCICQMNKWKFVHLISKIIMQIVREMMLMMTFQRIVCHWVTKVNFSSRFSKKATFFYPWFFFQLIDLSQVGNTDILHLKSSFEAYSFQFPASYIWIRKGFEISFHKVELPTIPAFWKLRTALSIIDFLANWKKFFIENARKEILHMNEIAYHFVISMIWECMNVLLFIEFIQSFKEILCYILRF